MGANVITAIDIAYKLIPLKFYQTRSVVDVNIIIYFGSLTLLSY